MKVTLDGHTNCLVFMQWMGTTVKKYYLLVTPGPPSVVVTLLSYQLLLSPLLS